MLTNLRRLTGALVCLGACAAQAQVIGLHSRDINGDGSIDAWYDSVLDVTWLADANFIATSGYTPAMIGPFPVGSDESGAAAGMESLEGAEAWAGSLDVFGVGGWRLPEVYQPAPTDCEPYTSAFCGGIASFASELTDLSGRLAGSTGPFLNVQGGGYFTQRYAEYWAPGGQDYFQVVNVFTGSSSGSDELGVVGAFAWAVRDGDVPVAAVPEPSTYLLMLLGLGAVAARRLKRRD